MNDTIDQQQRHPGGGGSPILRNSPTRKVESNTSTNNTQTSTSHHHPYLTHRTSNTNTSQSSLSSHGSGGGGGKIRSRSSSNSKLSNVAGHGGYGSLTKRKKLAHCLTVPELSSRQQQQHGNIRRGSRNRLVRDSRDQLLLSRGENGSSSVGQSGRRRSNRLLAAKSTPLIFGRGNSSIGSFGAPSRRISDYDNASNQQNEEWGVIQEQQQQPLLVSRGSSLLVSSSRLGQKQQQQQQPKENPLLTRLLDAKSCSTRLSVGDSRLPAADGPQTEVAIESNNFGTLAKAKVRAEKKVEEDAIKCIDSVDKGVENKVDGSPSSPDQDDKMLLDEEEEEEETSKENHKPQEDTSSSLPPSTASTSRTTSTTSKWSQTIVNSCPWWITSFLPSASNESQAFLMSPSSSVAVDDEEPSSSPHTSSSRPRSNSSNNNIPQKQLRFSTQQDIIPSPSYEVTSTDIKNSWLLATNIPTTLSNIQMISAHRGITVSYSLEAANTVGKTSMVHIEPTQLINRINLSKDRYRLAVLEEQERQREEERVAAAVVDTEGEKEEEMDEHGHEENDESSCNMDNVEKLGKIASIYSEWGVELALSRWWMER